MHDACTAYDLLYSVGRRSAEELCIIDREYMFFISISTVVTAVVRRMNWMHGSYDVFVVECCGDVLFAHAKWIDRTSGFSENEYE